MTLSKWIIAILLLSVTGMAQAGLYKDMKLVVDGVLRTYDLYIPGRADTHPRPLLIMYHGHIGNSDVMTGENGKHAPYKVWLQIAERENIIVAVPNGEKGEDDNRGWNDCRADTTTNPATDDVRFSLQLIEAIHLQFPVDRTHIYATGTSNGGNMVIRLAMEVPKTFAAVAAVVASNPVQSDCTEQRQPIPVLFMNGTGDPILPYQGGKVGRQESGRGTALSTPETVQYWLKVNGAQPTAQSEALPDREAGDKSSVVRHRYTAEPEHAEVVLYEVINGGHTEPSLQEHYGRLYKRIVGNQNYDIEMADEVWQFFKDKHR